MATKFLNLNTDSTFADNSDYYIPSQKAVKTALDGKQDKIIAGNGLFFKKEYEENYTRYGSVSVSEDYIASNFMRATVLENSSCLVSDNPFNIGETITSFEIVTSFTLTNINTTSVLMYCGTTQTSDCNFSIRFNSSTNILMCVFSSNGTSSDFGISGTEYDSEIVENKKYWVKILYNAESTPRYNLYISENGYDWKLAGRYNASKQMFVSDAKLVIGGGILNYSYSTIDLKETYIKVNNEIKWSAITAKDTPELNSYSLLALDEEKKDELLSVGKYDGKDITTGEIFTDYNGKFVKYENNQLEGNAWYTQYDNKQFTGLFFDEVNKVFVATYREPGVATSILATSTNGIDWKIITTTSNVLVGVIDGVWYLQNELTRKLYKWDSQYNYELELGSPTTFFNKGLAYNGTVYVGVNEWDRPMYSTDCSTWSEITSISTSIAKYGIVSTDGKFIIYPNSTSVYISTNGSTWSETSTSLTEKIRSCVCVGTIIYGTSGNCVYISQDAGSSWGRFHQSADGITNGKIAYDSVTNSIRIADLSSSRAYTFALTNPSGTNAWVSTDNTYPNGLCVGGNGLFVEVRTDNIGNINIMSINDYNVRLLTDLSISKNEFDENFEEIILTGTVAPTTYTKGNVGQLYKHINGTTAQLYVCSSVSTDYNTGNPTYTWNPIILNKSKNTYSVLIEGNSSAKYGVAVGYSASVSQEGGVAIGYVSSAYGVNSTAIGRSSFVNGDNSTAIGYNARILNNAESAIQLGTGENTESNTLKVGLGGTNYTVLQENGSIPVERLSTIMIVGETDPTTETVGELGHLIKNTITGEIFKCDDIITETNEESGETTTTYVWNKLVSDIRSELLNGTGIELKDEEILHYTLIGESYKVGDYIRNQNPMTTDFEVDTSKDFTIRIPIKANSSLYINDYIFSIYNSDEDYAVGVISLRNAAMGYGSNSFMIRTPSGIGRGYESGSTFEWSSGQEFIMEVKKTVVDEKPVCIYTLYNLDDTVAYTLTADISAITLPSTGILNVSNGMPLVERGLMTTSFKPNEITMTNGDVQWFAYEEVEEPRLVVKTNNKVLLNRASSGLQITASEPYNPSSNAVSIGSTLESTGTSSINIGPSSQTSESYSTAIGYLAKVTAQKAMQLGEGTNESEGTLQYRKYPLITSNGELFNERLPIEFNEDLSINYKKIPSYDDSYNSQNFYFDNEKMLFSDSLMGNSCMVYNLGDIETINSIEMQLALYRPPSDPSNYFYSIVLGHDGETNMVGFRHASSTTNNTCYLYGKNLSAYINVSAAPADSLVLYKYTFDGTTESAFSSKDLGETWTPAYYNPTATATMPTNITNTKVYIGMYDDIYDEVLEGYIDLSKTFVKINGETVVSPMDNLVNGNKMIIGLSDNIADKNYVDEKIADTSSITLRRWS